MRFESWFWLYLILWTSIPACIHGVGVERKNSRLLVTHSPECGNSRELYGSDWGPWDQSVSQSQCLRSERRTHCLMSSWLRAVVVGALPLRAGWTGLFSDPPLVRFVTLCMLTFLSHGKIWTFASHWKTEIKSSAHMIGALKGLKWWGM